MWGMVGEWHIKGLFLIRTISIHVYTFTLAYESLGLQHIITQIVQSYVLGMVLCRYVHVYLKATIICGYLIILAGYSTL